MKKWHNFVDYLRYYNGLIKIMSCYFKNSLESDVKPASIAMIAQFKILRDNFGIEPMVLSGLPAFAQHAMYNLYDTQCASIFTFPQDFQHLVKEFRQNTFGGITNVYMRHATTMNEPDAAHSAKFSSLGKS